METRQLEYFVEICRYSSLARTAESFYITQQGLSKSMKRLEQELQVELFVRTNRGMELTEAGEILLEHSKTLLADMASLDNAFKELRRKQQTRFSLAISSHMITGGQGRMSYETLTAFGAERPELDYTINELAGNACVKGLLEGAFDVVCIAGPFRQQGLKAILNTESKSGFVISRQNPLAFKRAIAPADLSGQTILVPAEDDVIETEMRAWLKPLVPPAKIICMSTNFNTCLQAVRKNEGMAMIMEGAALSMITSDVVIVPCAEDQAHLWKSYWVYDTANPNRKAIKAFLDYIVSQPF